MTRPDLTASKLEYTTQKLRQEWEAEKVQMEQEEQHIKAAAQEMMEQNENIFRPIDKDELILQIKSNKSEPIEIVPSSEEKQIKDESKSKKKRRKKSLLKKKSNNSTQRKNSSSSGQSDQNEGETENSISITTTSSNESNIPELSIREQSKAEEIPVVNENLKDNDQNRSSRLLELDIHFFSDTEVQSSPTLHRPSSPVQSDTEFEVSQREKSDTNSIMSNSASWKWGELPMQPEGSEVKQDVAENKRSMLSGMFSFMKQGRKLRKTNEGLYLEDFENEDIDPEVAALYFPEQHLRSKEKSNNGTVHEEDCESGNGTSVPQSPTLMEGIKSLDSDYDESKQSDKYLDFVAISLSGPNPTDEEFQKHQIQFSEVSRHFFWNLVSKKVVLETLHRKVVNLEF